MLDRSTKLGMFFQVQAQASAGLDASLVTDMVWDFYHNELTASTARIVGVTMPPDLGVGASAGGGFAWNFDTGVEAWYGRFHAVQLNLGLPFDLLQGSIGSFASGYVDNPSPLAIDWAGVQGVYGGLSTGVSANPVPVSGAYQNGVWSPNRAAIAAFADRFAGTMRGAATLRDHDDGACDPGEDCNVQFPGAAQQSMALCYEMGLGCAAPSGWAIAALPLAVRALRAYGGSVTAMCAGY